MNILQKNTLDIWKIPLPAQSLESLSLHLLQRDELTRFHRFYFSHHKRRYAQAKIALRTILGGYLNQAPETLQFNYNEYGKPELAQTHCLQFNVTHSKDMALLAINQSHPIGIDLEYFSARPYHGIAQHLFSFNEQHQLQQLPISVQALGFFSVWAQKEALIKAVGLGLNYPTHRFDVPLLPRATYLLHEPLNQQNWLMTAFMPYPGSMAAVCYHPSLSQIRYFHYDSPTHPIHSSIIAPYPQSSRT
jgi:4'-phosphopantetheinyl transferase